MHYQVIADEYGQTERWITRVIPGIMRALPRVEAGSLLDLGCGLGDFLPYAYKKGYTDYLGIDICEEMIARARNSYPDSKFIVASSADFIKHLPNSGIRFDAIVSIMSIPAMKKNNAIQQTFKQCYTALKEGGCFLLCTPHPSFDPYMEGKTSEGPVKTKFEGYFAEGKSYQAIRKFSSGEVKLTDHHWTLQSMINGILNAGLILQGIDECRDNVDPSAPPSHIVCTAKRPPLSTLL